MIGSNINFKTEMMKRVYTLILINAFIWIGTFASLYAQNDPTWDKTTKSKWNPAFRVVDIESSADGKTQKAYLYASQSKIRKPLIVSLHTWSGNYTQEDPLTLEIMARDWNYIHPDFRGANKTYESMGSNLVIADLEDAIQYALKNTNADPDEVHIIGVSGGGFATLVAYMNLRYPVKSFSAWAAISDLNAWYLECLGHRQKYAQDILKALSTDSVLNSEEAQRRSPLMQKFPKDLRKNAKLYIYEGIRDGYIGSVPITHSINMYNRLVGELKYGASNLDSITHLTVSDTNLVSDKEIIRLVTLRVDTTPKKQDNLFGRKIYLARKYKEIQLTIFEGGHEQLPQALGLIPTATSTALKYTLLTIGDSNGQNKGGWVDQLKKMMPQSQVVNFSQSGRTIGFDNGGRKVLNALSNVDSYLAEAQQIIGKKKFDFILVCLGTNDTKNEFADRQKDVVANFENLLKKIKENPVYLKSKPKLVYITPPPIRTNNILAKYQGGNERLAQLIPSFTEIATKLGFEVIDVYHPLLGVLDYYATDGVHMAEPGQVIISSRILEAIEQVKINRK